MQKITTFLMFNEKAEEAVKFYVSLFPNSKVNNIVKGPDGKAFHVSFSLAGQEYQAVNGGSHFHFSEGISLYVSCKNQAEIDRLTEKLTSKGGEQQPCGWLRDRWGVSWQIIPEALGEMMSDPKSGNSGKVMEALLKMKKIDIKTLKAAYKQK